MRGKKRNPKKPGVENDASWQILAKSQNLSD